MSSIDWSNHIALFGGSFDPPHLGHRKAIQELIERFHFKSTTIIPTGSHPFKSSRASYEHRIAMARLLFSDVRGVEISEIEKNDRISSTFQTLKTLKREMKWEKFTFVIGVELLGEIHKWNKFPEVLFECDWLVIRRKSTNIAADLIRKLISDSEISHLLRNVRHSENDIQCETEAGSRIHITETHAPDISSTQIRESIALKGAKSLEFCEHLSTDVQQYIQNHQLYGMEKI